MQETNIDTLEGEKGGVSIKKRTEDGLVCWNLKGERLAHLAIILNKKQEGQNGRTDKLGL